MTSSEGGILALQGLGYPVNFERSDMKPSRVAEHWDFTCDPDTMDISLPQAEAEEIANKVRRMTDKKADSPSKTPQGTSALSRG